MSGDWSRLLSNLALSGVMVTITVLLHFWGLVLLTRLVSHGGRKLRAHESHGRAGILVLLGVFGVFALHTLEIWSYAGLYQVLGEFHSFIDALYFSTTAFASLGFGDIVLSPHWRLISAIEAANGVILFAWSTAFLWTLTRRLGVFAHDWLGRDD